MMSRLPLVGAAAVAALSACAPRPACDSEAVQTRLRAIIGERTQQTISTLDGIRTTSRSGSGSVCTAHIAAETGEEANITYSLTVDGRQARLLVTRIDQQMARCDSPWIVSAIREGVGNRFQQTITGVTSIVTTSRSPAQASCTAHVAAASGAEADIRYTLSQVANGDTRYQLTGLTPASPRGNVTSAP